MQAFTIGNWWGYDKSLATEAVVTKLGKSEDYEGGWVWEHAEAAFAFIDSQSLPWEAGVYELRLPAPWADCASAAPSADGVHRLLRDAIIVRRIGGPGLVSGSV